MVRLVLLLLVIAAAATGLSWLADQPGTLVVNWQGYELETSVFRAFVLLLLLLGVAIVVWSILRNIWLAPASVGHFFNRRRQRRGLDAISAGIIAIGAGDRGAASQYALAARRALPDEPLTHLLRAQAAQLAGDRVTSRRIFEAMLGAPETEVLGLRGLFLEAEREGETEAATQFAERAVAANPKLAWPVDALFEMQAKAGNWAAALKTLNIARRHGHIDKRQADRRRAVLLTAMAQAEEERDSNRALELALEAHALAPALVPAAAIAGRLLAGRGNPGKVARVVERTWRLTPHPELATAYAYSRLGDSPHDRLARIQHLAQITPNSAESSIAVATAAIDAREFDKARSALAPLLEGRLTQRVATLMARIESEQHGDAGRVREWLARAVNAPRDPAWTADGLVSDTWAPLSPVTRALDAYEWRVPAESVEARDAEAIAAKLEELVALGTRRDSMPALPVAATAGTDKTTGGPHTTPTGPSRGQTIDRDAQAVTASAHSATAEPTGDARPPAQVAMAASTGGVRTPVAERLPSAGEPAAAVDDPSRTPLVDYAPPRPAYAGSLVKRKSSGAPRLSTAASAAAPIKGDEVEALASAIAVKPAAMPSPIREAAAAASAALAAQPTAAQGPSPHSGATAERATPVTVAVSTHAAAAPPTGNGQVRARPARKPVEAKIFVAPRAPDDPGTEPVVVPGDGPPLRGI